jgi:hypothetical protein
MQIFIFSFRNCTGSPLYWNVLRRQAARWLFCACRALFCISNAITLCTARAWVGDLLTLSLDGGIGGLIPQSPRDLNRQASARVSQAVRTSYLCHVIAVTMQLVMCLSFEHERVRKTFKPPLLLLQNTLTYAHTTSRILPKCDTRLG